MNRNYLLIAATSLVLGCNKTPAPEKLPVASNPSACPDFRITSPATEAVTYADVTITPTKPVTVQTASGPLKVQSCAVSSDPNVYCYPARQMRVYMSEAARRLDGPVIFYWHGTGSNPAEVGAGIAASSLREILDMGGIVIAPWRAPVNNGPEQPPADDPNDGRGPFPWYNQVQRDDDFIVADEVLACAQQKLGINTGRIHAMGMSAGGLMATQMTYQRSNYIASSVIYSGGFLVAPPRQDPTNKNASLIFHGGPTDEVIIRFEQTSTNQFNDMKANGQFAAICNHGQSHWFPVDRDPNTLPNITDARPFAWQFLYEHPYGTSPSPYAGQVQLPPNWPTFCQR